MPETLNLSNHITAISVIKLIVFISGIPITYFLSKIIKNKCEKKFSLQTSSNISKLFWITCLGLILVNILNLFGFKLGAILGAAGIAGIAIGFASQTSLSNFISGLFLISEKPFEIGDIIQVDDKVGVVLSIDMLSVKIRQFNNQYIRIPNESLIKSPLSNITKYPIRRIDLNIGIAYKENTRQVLEILKDLIKNFDLALDEPEPVVIVKEFGDSSVNLFIGFWIEKDYFLKAKNEMLLLIKEKFEQENIEIPFPHLTVYGGTEMENTPLIIDQNPPSNKI